MNDALPNTNRLLEIMRALRDPNSGCPWDIEQTHESLRKYAIEEAYEVADAIEQGDEQALIEELGDLLLQIVFHAEIARAEGRFDFERIAGAIGEKLVARHPHVFGDAPPRDIDEQSREWEAAKARERGKVSITHGVALGLPALSRAYKLQERVARYGMDEPVAGQIPALAKQLLEMQDLQSNEGRFEGGDVEAGNILGELLFEAVRLGRAFGADPEEALRAFNNRYCDQIRRIEAKRANTKSASE